MCVIAWAWRAHPDYPLVVLANRDERHIRPAEPLHWWQMPAEILAGRDVEAGGTWLGLTRTGRIAAVTNRRGAKPDGAPSRGGLAVDYLSGAEDPLTASAALTSAARHYAGFNLLLGDGEALAFVSNREPNRLINPGIYGMANDALGEDVAKVHRLVQGLERWVEAKNRMAPARWFEWLADDRTVPGRGAESAIFVHGVTYGTRASSIVAITTSGEAFFAERCFDARARLTGHERFRFELGR